MYNVTTRYIHNQQKPGHSLGKKIKVGIVSQNKEQTKKTTWISHSISSSIIKPLICGECMHISWIYF